MTRKELARFTRALMPYMSSTNAMYASSLSLGLDMAPNAADVSTVAGMVAPHIREQMPDGLRAILAQMEAES